MINEAELKNSLVNAFNYMKADHERLAELNTQVAALREVLRGPGHSAAFEKHLRDQDAANAQVEHVLADMWDDMVRTVNTDVFPA
jgi:hypothetical protein